MLETYPSSASAASFESPSNDDRTATILVWCSWGILFFAALLFVHMYGCNIPFCDEWMHIPQLVGDKPFDLAYLWEQHNEHRIPLPKLIAWALLKATRFDYRAGMFLNALCLGFLAMAMLLAIKKLRGYLQLSDMFFPIALLHLGHSDNLLWSFQISLVSSAVLSGVLLIIIVQSRESITFPKALLSGIALLLLPLCGANGLLLVPLLAAWFIVWGIRNWKLADAGSKRNSSILIFSGLCSLVLVGLYLYGYHRPPSHNLNPKPLLAFNTALECLTMSAGPAVISLWPVSGFVVIGLILITTAPLLFIFWQSPQERFRSAGLILYALSFVVLIGVIGWGRAGYWRHAGFAARYAVLTVPALCCSYFIWEILGSKTYRFVFQTALFILVCSLLGLNASSGISSAKFAKESFKTLRHDVHAGFTPQQLAQKYSYLFTYDLNLLASGMETMSRAKLGIFKSMDRPPKTKMAKAATQD